MSLKPVKVSHNEEVRLMSMASALYESDEPLLGHTPMMRTAHSKTAHTKTCKEKTSISNLSLKNPHEVEAMNNHMQIQLDWPTILATPDHMKISVVLMSKTKTSLESMKPEAIQVFKAKDLKRS
jgi:hypothetical protein